MESILLGFSTALAPGNLLHCFLGVLLGTAIGVLPGIGAVAAVSMLLPVTYYLDPTAALILLSGVYYGAEYGGSTASILMNMPGTPSSAVTALDGHPLAKQGRAGVALLAAVGASFIGGSIGIIIMIIGSPLVIAMALAFGPAEYFAVMLFGLIAAATIAQGAPVKGLAMVALGLAFGTIGIDLNTGVIRYDVGVYALYDGINTAIIAMGLFGISEIIAAVRENPQSISRFHVTLRSMLPTRDDLKRTTASALRGSGIGSLVGVLPGAGTTLASFLSYAFEKRTSRAPDQFGRGAVEGVAGPEAANNAAAQVAFIPTLTMGIPGSATLAIIMSALMIHGIQPGPRMIAEMPEIYWGVIASFWIGNLLLLVLNIPLIGLWVRVLAVPYKLLYPSIVCLVCMGVYGISNNIFDIWLLLFFGLLGYAMRLLAFEPAPLLIGFVLSPMLEENFRRAILLFRGDYLLFFVRPVSGILLIMAIALIAYAIWCSARARYGAS